MATKKIELGQKDAAIAIRWGLNDVTLETSMPDKDKDKSAPVTQPEFCALYLMWAMEQEDMRGKFMTEMEQKKKDSEKEVEKN